MNSGSVGLASVLMAVYNERVDFLTMAVESILQQTQPNFEFVILDDGSDDPSTISALGRLAKQDRRIRLFREPHRGLTRTLNTALFQYCRGEVIFRQDSDDWSEPHRLEEQLGAIRADSALGLLGSFAMLHQENGTPLWVERFPTSRWEILATFPSMNPFCHGAVCFRRDAAVAVGGYRESFRCSQDYDFFWRLAESCEAANLPSVLYHHRRTRVSVSSVQFLEQERVRRITIRLAQMRGQGMSENFESAQSEVDTALLKAKTVRSFNHADQLMLAGLYRSALRSYLSSLRRFPWNVVGYLKLLRLGLFVLLPRMERRFLFRRGYSTR